MEFRKILGIAVLAASGLLVANGASAALTLDAECDDVQGAEANGFDPGSCAYGDGGNGAGAEEAAVEAVFGGDFLYIGKYEKDDGATDQDEGYTLLVSTGDDDWDYSFSLTGCADCTIDFVLFVKQGGVDDEAYYWSGLLMDIDGFFNSLNVNLSPDYSHVSGFVRVTSVPEPATLGLLGLGLAGLGLGFRRRRKI